MLAGRFWPKEENETMLDQKIYRKKTMQLRNDDWTNLMECLDNLCVVLDEGEK